MKIDGNKQGPTPNENKLQRISRSILIDIKKIKND
jgi:hypothetical protein